MKELLKRIITEYWELKVKYIPRNLVNDELIKEDVSFILIGPRRAGKSYTLYEIRDKLQRPFVYINFEDERLLGFRDFDLILEAYYELQEGKPVLILDEIQNIPGWERFVRRMVDQGHKVIISGSNSQMLSSEIAQRLGGRFLNMEIYPLSSREFLTFKGLQPTSRHFYSKKRFEIKRLFEEYFKYGGFPEITLLDDPLNKERMLRTYFDLVFYKDIVSREKVENYDALRLVIRKLRENIGKVITPRTIYSLLKEQGAEIGPNTVERYIEYLERAFLIKPVLPYSKSVRKHPKKKRYFIDNGYLWLLRIKEDKGMMLENLVFTELLKKGKKVHYHKEKKECDFIVDGNEAIQVTYELSPHNVKREVEGLKEALELHNLKRGYIITYDQEEEIDGIKVVPFWKWALTSG